MRFRRRIAGGSAEGSGRIPGRIDAAVEADEVRARYAEWILVKKQPSLLLLHLLALDHIEHETGPFSPEAIAILERLDAAIGKLRATAERAYLGRVIFAVASDHGFVKAEKQVNFGPAFVQAGLISLDAKEKVKAGRRFRGDGWVGGDCVEGSEGHSGNAAGARVVEKLASDPANGIDRVLEADDLHARGGYPTASFLWIEAGWKNGYALTGRSCNP